MSPPEWLDELMPAAQASGRSAHLHSPVDPYVPAIPSPLRLSSTPTLSNDNGHGNRNARHDVKRRATGPLARTVTTRLTTNTTNMTNNNFDSVDSVANDDSGSVNSELNNNGRYFGNGNFLPPLDPELNDVNYYHELDELEELDCIDGYPFWPHS